jgi:hypothetical protein
LSFLFKTIAIHQPNFLPWPGYFLKIVSCDVFVFHDNVQITKRGYTRRTKISSNKLYEESQWLTVPLKKHSDFALIKDLEISWDTDWPQKHLNQIKSTYYGCPRFDEFFKILSYWYQQVKEIGYLSDMNIFFIRQILKELGIEKEIFKSSELPVGGKATSYNLAITQHLNGTQYLCGNGASKYQDDQQFLDHHIQVRHLDAIQNLGNEFLNINLQVSIIELFMNVEIDAIRKVFRKLAMNG